MNHSIQNILQKKLQDLMDSHRELYFRYSPYQHQVGLHDCFLDYGPIEYWTLEELTCILDRTEQEFADAWSTNQHGGSLDPATTKLDVVKQIKLILDHSGVEISEDIKNLIILSCL